MGLHVNKDYSLFFPLNSLFFILLILINIKITITGIITCKYFFLYFGEG